MMRVIVVLLLAIVCCAQQPDSQVTFEVASIKPSAPPEGGRMVMGARGGPGSADPIRFTASNFSLSSLISMAYDLKSYQLSAPSWLNGERFDIVAKVPPGATREQFRLMLQNLLAERFKLVIHRETKELPMFDLVVGKGGPKFKESADQTDSAPAGAPPPPPGGGPMQMKMGKDGLPEMPAGRTMMMMMGGRARMTAYKETMQWLATRLSTSAGRPVMDATGLTKKYDFTLDFAPEGGGMGPGGMAPPAGGGGGGAMVIMAQVPGPGGPSGHTASDAESVPTLATALQEQLGLKLESKKGPVEMIVVDKIEKVPTEN